MNVQLHNVMYIVCSSTCVMRGGLLLSGLIWTSLILFWTISPLALITKALQDNCALSSQSLNVLH